jgi:uncharacterized protein (TIGR00297 family)
MIVPRPFSEDARQFVHVAMGTLALSLRYLTAFEGMVLASMALAFNVYALRRVAEHLYRPHEARHRLLSGITLYPLAILLLLLSFPNRLDIVAAAWGVLAFGDGMATIAGRYVRSPRIPWNPDKSVAGSAAFVLFGGAAASFLCWWCAPTVVPPAYLWFSLWMPMLAAVVAAAVETIPIKLDDNISVPAAAAAVLWTTSLISEDLAVSVGVAASGTLPLVLAANVAVAGAGYAARTVTKTGAICGAALGTAIAVTAGWGGWALLLATFAVAVVTSRLGLRRKTMLGIAEERGGRRGAGNAIANTGVAAAAAAMGALSYAQDAAHIAFVAALAAGGSDTVASEIGKAWGRRTLLVPTFRPVTPGTSGAVSVEGTAAGLAGAVALAVLGVACGLVPSRTLPAIVAAATIGSFAESALGATLEEPGVLNNDVLNFLNTAIAAAVAILLVDVFR